MYKTIEDFLAQQPNIKKACEIIRGKEISSRTWYNWETIVGAAYTQGKPVEKRNYTLEQTQLFICLVWMRRLFPKADINYRSLRNFFHSNEYKIEEVLDACCAGVPPKKEAMPGMVALAKVKECCDAIANHVIGRKAWAYWKQHLQIEKRVKFVEEGKAALLVFMACWRNDNYNTPFPSVSRLRLMMESAHAPQLSLETASSGKMQYQWAMQGCQGKDLPKYLAAHGYKVALNTLYKWGEFSKRRHYSVSELAEWKKIAASRRCA